MCKDKDINNRGGIDKGESSEIHTRLYTRSETKNHAGWDACLYVNEGTFRSNPKVRLQTQERGTVNDQGRSSTDIKRGIGNVIQTADSAVHPRPTTIK